MFDILSDEEIIKAIGERTQERYLARRCTDAEAKSIAKAALQDALKQVCDELRRLPSETSLDFAINVAEWVTKLELELLKEIKSG